MDNSSLPLGHFPLTESRKAVKTKCESGYNFTFGGGPGLLAYCCVTELKLYVVIKIKYTGSLK